MSELNLIPKLIVPMLQGILL